MPTGSRSEGSPWAASARSTSPGSRPVASAQWAATPPRCGGRAARRLPGPSTTPGTSRATICSPRPGAVIRTERHGSGWTSAPPIPSAPRTLPSPGCSARTERDSASTSGPGATARPTGAPTSAVTYASTRTPADEAGLLEAEVRDALEPPPSFRAPGGRPRGEAQAATAGPQPLAALQRLAQELLAPPWGRRSQGRQARGAQHSTSQYGQAPSAQHPAASGDKAR